MLLCDDPVTISVKSVCVLILVHGLVSHASDSDYFIMGQNAVNKTPDMIVKYSWVRTSQIRFELRTFCIIDFLENSDDLFEEVTVLHSCKTGLIASKVAKYLLSLYPCYHLSCKIKVWQNTRPKVCIVSNWPIISECILLGKGYFHYSCNR